MYDINNINYVYYGTGKDTIVLLHGWGQNISMMQPIGELLKNQYKILIIDLPGFGNSCEPEYLLTINDYADLIHELIKKLKIKDPILVGHSFGGKISIVYSSKYDVKKLVLLASPFCPETNKITLKQKVFRFFKKVPGLNKLEDFAKKHIGSTDYKNSSVMMRKILVNSIINDYSDNAKKITCPTIMIWGDLDDAVPLSRAYELEKLIKDSAVIVYPNCTHYAYLEDLTKTINILTSFLGGK